MSLHELQRRAYLDAMGIECFAPRLQLPGAKPSRLCEMPELPAETAGAADEPGSQPARVGETLQADTRSGAADILNLLDEQAPVRQTQSASTTERSARPAAAREVPKFALSIVRAGQLLIVDDGLDGDADPQAYIRLIQNILFALKAPAVTLSIDNFRWPMSKARGSHIDQSESVARETLQAYLLKQLDQDQSQILLLMGQDACRYVAGEPVQLGEWLQSASLPVKCLATRSAGKVLTDNSLKPVLWQELQPLIQLLKSH